MTQPRLKTIYGTLDRPPLDSLYANSLKGDVRDFVRTVMHRHGILGLKTLVDTAVLEIEKSEANRVERRGIGLFKPSRKTPKCSDDREGSGNS